mgnify:CR=1 FL=1
MTDTPVQHVGGTTEPKLREGFAGSLFDTVETALPHLPPKLPNR